ncbi:MAG TPA: hypothetical protein VF784_10725 [Anaerolineales bacterium]
MNNDTESTNVHKLGFYASIVTAILAVVTFGIAIFTPPLSGPYCTSGCFGYPYAEAVSRFPRDYYWMYAAIMLTLAYYVLMACIHHFAPHDKKIFSSVGLSFALLSTAVLVVDYFLQVSVIQPSLAQGENAGIALLTQFNGHGVFIALEEIAYLMMSLSLLFMAVVFSGKTKLEKALRWLFISCFSLTILSFVLYSIYYGINREYRFEVASISFNWLTLIASGVLLSILFRRAPAGPTS